MLTILVWLFKSMGNILGTNMNFELMFRLIMNVYIMNVEIGVIIFYLLAIYFGTIKPALIFFATSPYKGVKNEDKS